jgi:hypothetical protein
MPQFDRSEIKAGLRMDAWRRHLGGESQPASCGYT